MKKSSLFFKNNNGRKELWMMARCPFREDLDVRDDSNLTTKRNELKVRLNIKDDPEQFEGVFYEDDKERIVRNVKELNVLEFTLGEINFLDIGFGDGTLIDYLSENGSGNYYGFEPEEIRVEIAKKITKDRNNVFIEKNTVALAEYEENFFDCISCFAVLEHVKNPMELIEKINKWLKPGGKIIFSASNADGFIPRFFGIENWRAPDSGHFWAPGKKTLFRLLELEGFKVKKSFTYGGFPMPRGIIKNLANKLFKKIGLGDILCLVAERGGNEKN
jgi:2-polyprenyl-3-methyl-5-hydroxy-6-metoxy-1,4-benzoquinol methylase